MHNPSARTAHGTMMLAAVETNFPPGRSLTRDVLATSILPLFLRLVALVTRLRTFREALVNQLERGNPGGWAGIACRKTYIDERCTEALAAGAAAVVDLGAGLDTRAYRIPGVERCVFLEVDLPVNLDRKRRWIARTFGAVPPHVRLVPVDFDREPLWPALLAHGLPTDAPAFFIWEGVTQYLQAAGVRATLAALAGAPRGSRLVFTYVLRDFIAGDEMYGLPALYRRFVVDRKLWHFGLLPDEVAPLLAEHGWRVVEHPTADEIHARYVRPTGRDLAVMAIERLVLAEKI